MSAEPVAAWLSAWRQRQGAPPPTQVPVATVTRQTPARTLRAKPTSRGEAHGFYEPCPWDYDGGVRREAVLDTDHRPPRVVRRVGWRSCLRCSRPFFSQDIVAHRLCDDCRLNCDRYT